MPGRRRRPPSRARRSGLPLLFGGVRRVTREDRAMRQGEMAQGGGGVAGEGGGRAEKAEPPHPGERAAGEVCRSEPSAATISRPYRKGAVAPGAEECIPRQDCRPGQRLGCAEFGAAPTGCGSRGEPAAPMGAGAGGPRSRLWDRRDFVSAEGRREPKRAVEGLVRPAAFHGRARARRGRSAQMCAGAGGRPSDGRVCGRSSRRAAPVAELGLWAGAESGAAAAGRSVLRLGRSMA